MTKFKSFYREGITINKGDSFYQFGSFHDRDRTFDTLESLWQSRTEN
jgi:hypothetical protein